MESLQVYFNGSLEIQRSLIANGYRVPLETPVPIIYGDMGGYEAAEAPEGALKGAILNPLRYGQTLDQMGWEDLGRRVRLTREEGSVELSLEEMPGMTSIVIEFRFTPGVPGYHLEKASYRQSANPNQWNNWAMFYVGMGTLNRIIRDVSSRIDLPRENRSFFWKHERLPRGGGDEDTYYVSADEDCQGLTLVDFELCVGCWDHVIDYFTHEQVRYQQEGFPSPAAAPNLRLRMEPDSEVRAKIGLAKITGKQPQFMFKLATFPERTISIQGMDREGRPITIEGKSRGRVEHCSHANRTNRIILNALDFLRSIVASHELFSGGQEHDSVLTNVTCGGRRIQRPNWFEG